MIKFRKYINFLIVPILLLGTQSCMDWLDLEPKNKLVKQEFWKKKEDVAAVMAAMYDAYRDNSDELWYYGEIRADMVETTESSFLRIAKADILSTNSKANWSGFYNAINLANTILEYSGGVLAEDKTFNVKLQKSYEAEALFIRAKCYFDMVRVWKEVPLALSASSTDTVSFSIPKSSEVDIIKQIEVDLLKAQKLAYTNENDSVPALFKGRANLYSINALLADVYLWNEKYDKCISVCDELINSGKFQLQLTEQWFDLYYPGNAPESIFELQFEDDIEGEENPFNINIIPYVGTSQITLKPIVLELFTTTDIRKGSPNPISKYQFKSLNPKEKRTNSDRDAHMIQYRYADVLLMKAEALAELGRFNESNDLINQILVRAAQLPITLDPDLSIFRSTILEQRAKEFALEGKRWFDVLRFAKKNNFANKQLIIDMIMEGADVKQRPILRSRVLDTMSYYLPIFEDEVKRNPKLIQNPYYDR